MLAFINANLIDGTGAAAIRGATVIVDGKNIAAVSAAAGAERGVVAGATVDAVAGMSAGAASGEAKGLTAGAAAGMTAGAVVGSAAPVPDGATVIDLKGKTLLPAFSDAHTHFGGTDLLSRPGLRGRDGTYDYALNSAVNIDWGVTTVRSAGDYVPDIISFRDDIAGKELRAPRILTAGRMFVAKGGHPLYTVYSADEGIRDNACVVCDERTDIDAEVEKLACLGVDWIKAFLSTANKMDYPNTVPRLTRETLRKITDSAHKRGKPVMLHVENAADVEEAIELGVDSVEHLIGVGAVDCVFSDDLIKKAARSATYFVPTLSGIKAHDGMLEGAEPVYPRLENAVKKMADAGVKFGVGCDSGIPFLPYGECVHTEMELFVSAGFTPTETLRMATSGNAKLFRLDSAIGVIQPGKLADIVVLDANPLEDIRNTRKIALVVKEGRIVADRMLSQT